MDKKEMWSLAAKNGFILSLITIIVLLLSNLTDLPDAASIVISIVKFVGIIILLYFLMKGYSKDKESVSYKQSFTYGFLLCLCSAVICTVFSVLMVTVIAPDGFSQSLEQGLAIAQSSGTSFNFDYDKIVSMLPLIIAISTFLNCIIFGLIESSIIANWTKKGNTIFSGEDINEI